MGIGTVSASRYFHKPTTDERYMKARHLIMLENCPWPMRTACSQAGIDSREFRKIAREKEDYELLDKVTSYTPDNGDYYKTSTMAV